MTVILKQIQYPARRPHTQIFNSDIFQNFEQYLRFVFSPYQCSCDSNSHNLPVLLKRMKMVNPFFVPAYGFEPNNKSCPQLKGLSINNFLRTQCGSQSFQNNLIVKSRPCDHFPTHKVHVH